LLAKHSVSCVDSILCIFSCKLFVVWDQALYVKTAEELFPCFVSLVFLNDGKLGGDSFAADFEAVWSLESIRRRAA
jgi:hypothetical protein